MLRRMSGVTKTDRIRNERIRGSTKVGEISKKVQDSRNDLSERGLSGEDAQDRPRWRRLTRHIDPT